MHNGTGLNEIVRKIQEIQIDKSLTDPVSQAFDNWYDESDKFDKAVESLIAHLMKQSPFNSNDNDDQEIYNNAINIKIGEILLNLTVVYQDKTVPLRSAAIEKKYHVAEEDSRDKVKWDKLHKYVKPAILKRIEDKIDQILERKTALDKDADQSIEYKQKAIYKMINDLKLIKDFQILGQGKGYFTLFAKALNKIGITKDLMFHADIVNAGIRDITLDIRTQMMTKAPNLNILNGLLKALEAHIRQLNNDASNEVIASLVIDALKDTFGSTQDNSSIYEYAQQNYYKTTFWQNIEAIEEKIKPKNQASKQQPGTGTFSDNDNVDNDLYDAETFHSQMVGESKRQGRLIITNIVIALVALGMITAILTDEAGFGTMAHKMFADLSEGDAERNTSAVMGGVGILAMFGWTLWNRKSHSGACMPISTAPSST